jgi:hypothetical protein
MKSVALRLRHGTRYGLGRMLQEERFGSPPRPRSDPLEEMEKGICQEIKL